MNAQDHGTVPGLAAPETTANLCPASAASVASDAVSTAGLNPQKESTLRAATTQSRGQNDQCDFADDEAAGKAHATIAARFAMRGYSLHQLADDTHLVTRWNLARPCIDLYAARRFLAQVEGTR